MFKNKDIEGLKTKVSSLDTFLVSLDSKLKKLNENLQAQIHHLHETVKSQESVKNDELTKKIDVLQKALSDNIKSIQTDRVKEVDKLKSQIDSLSNVLSKTKEELLSKSVDTQVSLTDSLSQSQKKIDSLQKVTQELSSEGKRLSDLLSQEISSIKNKIPNIDPVKKDLENTINLLKVNLDGKIMNLKEGSLRSSNEIASILKSQQSQSIRNANIEKEISIIKDTISGIVKDLSNIKIPDIKSEIEKINSNILTWKKEFKREILNSVESRLNVFNQEQTTKYYDILAKLIEFNKGFLVGKDTLKPVSKEEYDKIKAKFEKELLEAKWANKELQDGKKVAEKGRVVILKRKELYDELLRRERENKDTKEVKTKLEAYDDILKEIK